MLIFLRALFGDVVRNYRAVIDALGDPAVPLELNSPLAVVRARLADELHVPDVEAAFDDLASRHILDCDKEEKTYFWGPNAAELDGYRAALERF